MMIKRWMTVFLVLALSLMPGQAVWGQANSLSMQPRIADNAEADSAPVQRLAAGGIPAGLSGQEWSRMQTQMQAAQYQFTWQTRDGVWAYRAPNPALGLDLALGNNGLSAVYYGEKDHPAWQFGLRLMAYGKQPMPETLPDRALHAQRERVAYAWNAQVTEWYRNTLQGVEHGVTLFAPPTAGPVQLDFALTGDLRAEADGDHGVLLRTADGTAVLRYDQLAVYDRRGKELAARMAPIPGGLRITIDATGAAYPLTVDPLLHTQVVQLHASTPVPGAEFGYSVAVSADVLVVGAPNEDVGTTNNIGAAYVFHRDQSAPGAWGEVQILRADDGQAEDRFGWSVAISGDVIVVGALDEDGGAGDPRGDAGAAYVFQRVLGGTDDWEQQVILRASDAAAYDRFGRSVAISGDVIVVGAADKNSSAGVAYVFERGLSWGQVKILQAPGATVEDIFGVSVAVDGDVIVVGASCVDSAAANAGAAYVFQRNQGGANNWGQAAILYASDARANDRLGGSVAISGDVIVAGATGVNVMTDPGAAYVFQRYQGGANHWGQVRKLTASDARGGDGFGGSVAASGDVVVIGAANNDGAANNAGAVYVFQRDLGGGNRWGQAQALHAADAQASDGLGLAVAISGDVIVAGAPVEAGSGATYVFQRTENDPWRQTTLAHSSEAQAYDNFGDSAAISGDVLVVGAYSEDYGPGDAIPGAGTVYVFQRDQGGAGNWGEIPAILRDSDPQEGGHFGASVAVSGDVIVVGEPYKDVAAQNDGAVFIFERDQGGANQWYEVKMLQIPAGAADDRFGSSVAVSGDVVVVGALYKDTAGLLAGAAYVYQRDQGGTNQWGLVKTLQSSDSEPGDNFGTSVAVSGDVIVVGAWFEDSGGSDAGAAYVFQRAYGGIDNWGQVKKLSAPVPQAGAHFGSSVAVAGDVIAVGANAQDGYAGAVYVFHRDEGGASAWGWMQTLAPDEIRTGSSFGMSVAASRDVIVVGAPEHDGLEEDPIESAGAAFVFRRNESGIDLWDLLTTLRASDAQEEDYFGSVVGVSGDVIVAGAPGEDGGVGDPLGAAGAVYIFQSAPLVHLYLPLVLRAS